jgi:hypothetical protein
MKKIKFDLNGDNRPYVEGLEDAKESMFKDQYEQCILLIDAYLKGVKSMQETPAALRNSVDNNNNIIVFDGGRGTGKTSCMLSMANMLTSENHEIICQGAKYVARTKFHTIPMIDPSFFDEEHNILSLFIARLYSVFQEKEETGCPSDGKGNQYRNDLMKMFVKVQQNLRSMFGDKKVKDGMEYLVDVAASVDIKENIRKLVDLYLKYCGSEDGILLLLIDDIDIDSVHAYEMCEQLRKYFMQPNIITLMSMKIEQLAGIIQRQFTEEYLIVDDRYSFRRYSRVTIDERNEISERAERYLAKLLPAHQRIYMPLPSEYMDAVPVFSDNEKWGYNLSDGIKIKQVIPELIFLKTRFLFYNSAKRVSYIVPRNLRDMRQMFKLLLQMKDYAESGEVTPNYYNKEMFRQYFYNDWCDINLTEEYKDYADDVKRVQNVEELNYIVLRILDEITESSLKSRTGDDTVERIISPANTPFNISVGDVLAIIRLTQRTKVGEDIRKFLFFLKSFYSIQLYHAYDTISSSSEKDKEQERANLLIQKPEHDVVWNEYEAILGGSVFCTDLDELIPQDLFSNKISRSIISSVNFDGLFELCLNDWQKAREQNLIRLAEFLMLTIYYDGSKEPSTQLTFRSSPELCYDEFSIHTDLYFDLGALFFNLCRVERCFNRFQVLPHGKAFLNKLKTERADGRDPLFNDMREITLQNRHKEWKSKEEKWLSFCCFRNMEIMEDLLDTVRAKEYDEGLDSYDLLHNFFVAVASYSIKSYDRYDDDRTGEEDKPYTIHFEFFKKFAELISSENAAVKDHFMSIFNTPTIKNPFEDGFDVINRNS